MNREDLIGLIFDAVADGSKWRHFLDALRAEVNADRATFFIRDLLRETFAVVSWVGSSDEDIAEYARYAEVDPWNRLASLQQEGAVLLDSDYCPREEAEASIAYREFYQPRNCIHGFGAVILQSPTTQAIVTMIRGAETGPFGAAECGKLRDLLPHLRRAVLLQGELESLRRNNAAFTQHLDRYPHALCLLDTQRRVLYSNGAAQEIVAGRHGLRLREGRLVGTSPEDDGAFDKAMASAARGTVARATASAETPAQVPLRILFLPVRGATELSLGGPGATVATVILDLNATPKPNTAILRELYSLTRAEAEIAVRIGQGLAPLEIAEQLSIARETVRKHLGRIMAKTGTKQRGSLVSLVLKSTAFGPG